MHACAMTWVVIWPPVKEAFSGAVDADSCRQASLRCDGLSDSSNQCQMNLSFDTSCAVSYPPCPAVRAAPPTLGASQCHCH